MTAQFLEFERIDRAQDAAAPTFTPPPSGTSRNAMRADCILGTRDPLRPRSLVPMTRGNLRGVAGRRSGARQNVGTPSRPRPEACPRRPPARCRHRRRPFLVTAQQGGFEVAGTEVSAAGANYARERGFEVHLGQITDLDLPAESFEIATIWHVLEHVPDPAAVLRKVHSLLRPGGVLVVAVPNEENYFLRRRLGQAAGRSSPFDPLTFGGEIHLTYFRPATLRSALRAAAFSVLEFGVDDIYHVRDLKMWMKLKLQQCLAKTLRWHFAVAMYTRGAARGSAACRLSRSHSSTVAFSYYSAPVSGGGNRLGSSFAPPFLCRNCLRNSAAHVSERHRLPPELCRSRFLRRNCLRNSSAHVSGAEIASGTLPLTFPAQQLPPELCRSRSRRSGSASGTLPLTFPALEIASGTLPLAFPALELPPELLRSTVPGALDRWLRNFSAPVRLYAVVA